jgi:hypothetical protein
MTPIRAKIVGPSCSATRISACIAACHSSASCSAFGNCIAQRDQRLPARHRYRIEKPLIPEPLLGTANDLFFKGTSYKTAQMNLLLGDAEQ